MTASAKTIVGNYSELLITYGGSHTQSLLAYGRGAGKGVLNSYQIVVQYEKVFGFAGIISTGQGSGTGQYNGRQPQD